MCYILRSLRHTKESSCEERPERYIDDWGGDVDKPVWQERCYTKEQDVVEQMLSVALNLVVRNNTTAVKNWVY